MTHRWSPALFAAFLSVTGCKQVLGIGDPILLEDDGGLPQDMTGGGDDDSTPPDMSGPSCLDMWYAGTVTLGAVETVVTGAGFQRTAHLSDDELRVWYTALVNDDVAIHRATRTSKTQPFPAGTVVGELNSNQDEYDISLTSDELTAVQITLRNGQGDMLQARRADRNATFSAPSLTPMSAINGGDELELGIAADGLEVVFARGGAGILASTRGAVTANFGPSTSITTGHASDRAPSLSSDDRLLFFDSERNGPMKIELFYATRTGRSAPFSNVRAVPLVSLEDSEPMLSADGCTLYFTRSSAGDADIVAVRVQR